MWESNVSVGVGLKQLKVISRVSVGVGLKQLKVISRGEDGGW